MSNNTVTTTLKIEPVQCGNCHVWFGIESNMHTSVLKTGARFYCPRGHQISYSDNENKRLRREREQLRRERDAARSRAQHLDDQLEAEKRSRAAIKGHLTRVQNRIANGICPHCRRGFSNVAEHMNNKHPEFVKELEEKRKKVMGPS